MLRRLTPEGPVSTIIQMNRLEVWLGAAMAAPYPIRTPERDTVLRPSIRAFFQRRLSTSIRRTQWLTESSDEITRTSRRDTDHPAA